MTIISKSFHVPLHANLFTSHYPLIFSRPTRGAADRRFPSPPARPGPAPARPRDGRHPWTAEGRPGIVPARHAARQFVGFGPARGRLPGRSEGRRPAGHADAGAAGEPPGGLRRDDLRRDGHRLGIDSNARDIAGDGPPVRLTDRHDADGRGRTARRDAELLGDAWAMT